jgi:hypothetical protein
MPRLWGCWGSKAYRRPGLASRLPASLRIGALWEPFWDPPWRASPPNPARHGNAAGCRNSPPLWRLVPCRNPAILQAFLCVGGTVTTPIGGII